ncbi:MAG TPA: hypothetical protein ENJ89_07565, partial [Caldithrix abyssi]|nr:hypothetical protein [Caldithrix abyssi]
MILKILFISDRVSDYHTFVRSHSSLTAGLDLLNHVEANRRYQFPTFYDIFIIDLHDPWIAIPPWLREQAQQHYFHQFIFISD